MLEYLTLAFAVLSLILHAIKGKTKTKVDDALSDALDKLAPHK